MPNWTPPSDSMFRDHDDVIATWPEGLLIRVWRELKDAAADARTPRRRARLESSADHVEDYIATIRQDRIIREREQARLPLVGA